MPDTYNLIAVIGPTASGKTSLAARLAHQLHGAVISADSRQVYRRLNLGTGKDYDEYRVGNERVPVHLLDIADPGYKYSVFEYQRDFNRTFLAVRAQNRWPILCGGSGMYIEAATRGYRLTEVPRNETLRSELNLLTLSALQKILTDLKKLHNRTDLDTRERAIRAIEIETYVCSNPAPVNEMPRVFPLYVGVKFDRFTERVRITERLQERLKQGMVEEVRELLESGISADDLIYYGLEYRFITQYLTGNLSYEKMVMNLNTAICQFAKRQRTWFRKMEREGCRIYWLEGELSLEQKIARVIRLLGHSS